MNLIKLGAGVTVALLIAFNISAQTVTSNTVGHIAKGGEVNFLELSNYSKTHPATRERRLPFDEGDAEEMRPARAMADPLLVHIYNQHQAETPHTAYLPISPAPVDTFQGQKTDGNDIPPDVHGAVNETYAVSTHNDSIVIQSRATAATVYKVGIDNFWSSLESSGTGAYDPRVVYDPNYQRWIMVADCYGELATSQIMIAVSQTSDPTGSWWLYKLVVGTSTGSGQWLDFPCLGFNNRWIAVSGNFFQVTGAGSFTNDVLYIFDYASMMSGAAMGTYGTLYPPGGSFTICPASTFDAGETNLFCGENWNSSAGQLKLYKVTGSIGSLTLSSVGYPATTKHWQSSPGGSDFVPQLGTTNKLQANDDRINNFQQRNNTLWTAHTAFFPASGTVTRASSMWWQIDTNATVAQNDTIDDNTSVNNYWFPSISANANNDALIGFAASSAAIHPSCAYSIHLHTDAASTHRSVYIYKHGQNTYYQTFGSGENRWGDYSATCTDPTNGLDFWTLQETVPTTANEWVTWWAHVQTCVPLAAPTAAVAPTSQCAGTSAWYSVNPVAGATGYAWTVTGTGWTDSVSATEDSVYLTASPSAGSTVTLTAAATDTCGAGAVYTFTITALPLPNETITATDSICTGAATGTFSAAATGSPSFYTWTVLGSGWSGASSTSTLTANVGTGTGTIIVNATNGCGTGPNDTLLVNPSSGPGAATAINSVATVYCTGSTYTFTTPAVTGATSYTWTVSGTGWSGSSTTNSITVTVGTGTADITVTPVDACGNGTPFTITGITPTPGASATFVESTHVTTAHANIIISFTGTSGSGYTYTWDFDGGVASPGTGTGPQTVYWNTPGTYTVTLTVDNGGCSATYTDTVQVGYGLAVQQVAVATFDASIVPNPNDGTFDVLFDQQVTRPVSIKISDVQGRTVYTNDYGKINSSKLSVVTNQLAPGTYNASIYVDGSFVTKKITIVR